MAPTRLPNYGIQLKMTHSPHKKKKKKVWNSSEKQMTPIVFAMRATIRSLIDLRLPHPTTPHAAIPLLLVHLALNLSGPVKKRGGRKLKDISLQPALISSLV